MKEAIRQLQEDYEFKVRGVMMWDSTWDTKNGNEVSAASADALRLWLCLNSELYQIYYDIGTNVIFTENLRICTHTQTVLCDQGINFNINKKSLNMKRTNVKWVVSMMQACA